MRQLFRFMFHHASHLTFGAMLMAMSSFGQTYFVSLYGQDFREAFGLTDGGLGGLYAIGTVMSAITLTWAGRLIDYTTTRRFTLAVTLLLLTACLLVSGAQAAWMHRVLLSAPRRPGTDGAYCADRNGAPVPP